MWKYLVDDIKIIDLIYAARWPLYLTAAAMPLAVAFGLILALMRMSRIRILSWPATCYIELMRGTPLFVQLYLVYYSLPEIAGIFGPDAKQFMTLEAFPAAVLCLAANYAAYEAEIHRAGLLAVDKGQREAALSIGMSEWQAFYRVTLPQAFRIVLPPIINDAIAMQKDSCLTSAIGVKELLSYATSRGNNNEIGKPKMYLAAGVLYTILSLAFYFLGKFIERKLKARGGAELNLNQARH
ncbi:MAG: amino acid ABC transporter permease [Planctomycetota bacterium]